MKNTAIGHVHLKNYNWSTTDELVKFHKYLNGVMDDFNVSDVFISHEVRDYDVIVIEFELTGKIVDENFREALLYELRRARSDEFQFDLDSDLSIIK